MHKTVHITDDNFEEEVLKSELPVLVDFWAEWCGPCRTLGPTLEEIAADYEGRVKIAKLNVDENPKHAQAFGIRAIPTMIMFKDGSPGDRIMGALPRKNITRRYRRGALGCARASDMPIIRELYEYSPGAFDGIRSRAGRPFFDAPFVPE